MSTDDDLLQPFFEDYAIEIFDRIPEPMRPVINFAGAKPDDVSNLLRQLPEDDTVEVIFDNIRGEHSIEIYKKIWLLVPNPNYIRFRFYPHKTTSFSDLFAYHLDTKPFFNFMLESRANLYTICHKIPRAILLSLLRHNLSKIESWEIFTKNEGFLSKNVYDILTTPKLLTSKNIQYISDVLYYVTWVDVSRLTVDMCEQIYTIIERNYDAFVTFYNIETKPEPPCAVQFVDIGEFESV